MTLNSDGGNFFNQNIKTNGKKWTESQKAFFPPNKYSNGPVILFVMHGISRNFLFVYIILSNR
jgi:hypothetical protein